MQRREALKTPKDRVLALLADDRVLNLFTTDYAHCLAWDACGGPAGMHKTVMDWLAKREIDAAMVCGTRIRFTHLHDKFHFAMMWKGSAGADLILNPPQPSPPVDELRWS